MKKLNTYLLFLLGALSVLKARADDSSNPTWWTVRGVVDSDADVSDYTIANLGQLKHFAYKAYLELEEMLLSQGGAGDEIKMMVQAWLSSSSTAQDYSAANLGQLKFIGDAFYQRIIDIGVLAERPWSDGTSDDQNYAAVNLGQLKNVFDFPFPGLQQSLPYNVSFDPETSSDFLEGALWGQGGWLTNSDEIQVNLAPSVGGETGVISAPGFGNSASLKVSSGGEQQVNLNVRLFTSKESHFSADTDILPEEATSIISYDPTRGIVAFNGITNSWIVIPSTLHNGSRRWYDVTIEQNYDTKRWAVFVDGDFGNKIDDLGFRDPSINQINEVVIENRSATTSYLGALEIVSNP